MIKPQTDEQLGRFLSLILRHKPSAAGITLDSHGWADVNELIAGVNQTGKQLNREILERIVRGNQKQRYSFNSDHSKIRANQGHSIPVDLEFTPAVPPSFLFHGTTSRFLESIRKQGITRQSRQYVHLSSDRKTAEKVGARHGKPVILVIDAQRMLQDGRTFYLSENGVWLCKDIPWNYVKEVEYPAVRR